MLYGTMSLYKYTKTIKLINKKFVNSYINKKYSNDYL